MSNSVKIVDKMEQEQLQALKIMFVESFGNIKIEDAWDGELALFYEFIVTAFQQGKSLVVKYLLSSLTLSLKDLVTLFFVAAWNKRLDIAQNIRETCNFTKSELFNVVTRRELKPRSLDVPTTFNKPFRQVVIGLNKQIRELEELKWESIYAHYFIEECNLLSGWHTFDLFNICSKSDLCCLFVLGAWNNRVDVVEYLMDTKLFGLTRQDVCFVIDQ